MVILVIATLQRLELRLPARLALREQPLQCAVGNVALLRMQRLAFAPVDSDQLAREQAHLLAQKCAGTAALPQRLEIVAPEGGNRLVVGAELWQQPHQGDMAMGRLLQATAGAPAREIAVQLELQEIAGMIRRAACRGRVDALKAALCQIECSDKGIHAADGVLFCAIVVEALWKEARLVTVHALHMTHNSTKLQERGSESGWARVDRIVEF